MMRLSARTTYKKFPGKHRTWFAGETAERGSYVCVHCNTQTSLDDSNHLPLCPTCYGRRFKQM